MIERRKYSRTKIHSRVFFEYCDAHGKEVSQNFGTALDISEKGMLLESSSPIHASTVKVTVPIKEKDTVQVTGKIIYSIPVSEEHYHTGIVFEDSRDAMAELVETLSSKQ